MLHYEPWTKLVSSILLPGFLTFIEALPMALVVGLAAILTAYLVRRAVFAWAQQVSILGLVLAAAFRPAVPAAIVAIGLGLSAAGILMTIDRGPNHTMVASHVTERQTETVVAAKEVSPATTKLVPETKANDDAEPVAAPVSRTASAERTATTADQDGAPAEKDLAAQIKAALGFSGSSDDGADEMPMFESISL